MTGQEEKKVFFREFQARKSTQLHEACMGYLFSESPREGFRPAYAGKAGQKALLHIFFTKAEFVTEIEKENAFFVTVFPFFSVFS